ncbi:hypothetical protein KBTX_04089 [wastewater metagenome]|uniref:Uncharacterized protein n=2 Tax=unclassified sequences TaxID=12908 RepID=A0A5B8RIE3_9ZZZZ|nr:hypothetical protein KBTEX_04089 [uncultured organism]
MAGQPLLADIVERADGLPERDIPVRPVEQQQIDAVHAETPQALAHGALQVAVAETVHPDLGGQPDVLPGHAGIGDTPADTGLVAVHLRRVDVAVARLQGGTDHLAGVVVIELEGAEAQLRDAGTGGFNVLHCHESPLRNHL